MGPGGADVGFKGFERLSMVGTVGPGFHALVGSNAKLVVHVRGIMFNEASIQLQPHRRNNHLQLRA